MNGSLQRAGSPARFFLARLLAFPQPRATCRGKALHRLALPRPAPRTTRVMPQVRETSPSAAAAGAGLPSSNAAPR